MFCFSSYIYLFIIALIHPRLINQRAFNNYINNLIKYNFLLKKKIKQNYIIIKNSWLNKAHIFLNFLK
jgi:hypothetical protein